MNKTIGFLISILLVNTTYAGDNSGVAKATASLSSTCTISSHDVNFGNITNPKEEAISVNMPLNMLCSNQVTYKIYQGLGANGNATIGRKMKGQNHGQVWGYILCKTSSATINSTTKQCSNTWFNSDYVSGMGNGDLQAIPVYFITWGSYTTPDDYSDQTTTTISF